MSMAKTESFDAGTKFLDVQVSQFIVIAAAGRLTVKIDKFGGAVSWRRIWAGLEECTVSGDGPEGGLLVELHSEVGACG